MCVLLQDIEADWTADLYDNRDWVRFKHKDCACRTAGIEVLSAHAAPRHTESPLNQDGPGRLSRRTW